MHRSSKGQFLDPLGSGIRRQALNIIVNTLHPLTRNTHLAMEICHMTVVVTSAVQHLYVMTPLEEGGGPGGFRKTVSSPLSMQYRRGLM